MASLATTTRRVAKHPATRRVGWIVAATAAAAAAVGAAIYLGDKKSASGTPAVPAAPPGTPAGSIPLWTQVTPVANPQLPGTYMANIPAGASFLFADSMSDPNVTSIVNGLNAAANAGTVTGAQAYQTGTVAPSFWPADPFGASAYRASGVANAAFSLVLGALGTSPSATPPMVWVLTGWAPAATPKA
jgi:hypothetical protein